MHKAATEAGSKKNNRKSTQNRNKKNQPLIFNNSSRVEEGEKQNYFFPQQRIHTNLLLYLQHQYNTKQNSSASWPSPPVASATVDVPHFCGCTKNKNARETKTKKYPPEQSNNFIKYALVLSLLPNCHNLGEDVTDKESEFMTWNSSGLTAWVFFNNYFCEAKKKTRPQCYYKKDQRHLDWSGCYKLIMTGSQESERGKIQSGFDYLWQIVSRVCVWQILQEVNWITFQNRKITTRIIWKGNYSQGWMDLTRIFYQTKK